MNAHVVAAERIFLIGMPGSGKTEVAKIMAAHTGRMVVDLDALIEEAAQQSVASIFEHLGEPAFRLAERAALQRVISDPLSAVVATGGGVVLDPVNRAAMKENGTVVWLDVALDALAARVASEPGTRPLLVEPGALERLLDERHDLYEDAASVVVDGEGSPEAVAEAVLAAVGEGR